MKTTHTALRFILAATLGLGLITGASAAITDQQVSQLRPGMSEQEVASILGKPGRAMTYALNGQTDWTYSNDHIDYDSSTEVVHFDATGHFDRAYIIDTNAF